MEIKDTVAPFWMRNDNDTNCGKLPLAYPYVRPQEFAGVYPNDKAIMRGTIFSELDLPFERGCVK